MIRVGDLAKQANISKRTLYYYEQIGLLQPSLVPENRYRYYDEHAILRLQKIRLLKSIGYTLEQIKDLFENQKQTEESDHWITSLKEQVELIEQQKEALSRKQYFLRSTIHSIQLKGTSDVKDLVRVILAMEDRPLVEGVVPAEFKDDLQLTPREKAILADLPVLGSTDKRMEELVALFQHVRRIMPASPDSPEAQALAGELYEKALDLFQGDELLLDKYWHLISSPEGAETVVIGMDQAFMSYLDEMIGFYLAQREDQGRA